MQNERLVLLQRIVKIKARKGKVYQGIKVCKNCAKEFLEKENFNWSCRTHKSSFGGEMWWCCGKRGQNTPGCKFSKHEVKNEEDEDEEMLLKKE